MVPVAFELGGDSYKFEGLVFSGGKQRIKINGSVVFVGLMTPKEPAVFAYAGREYRIAKIKNDF